MGWLSNLFQGADEVGWDDLRQRVVDAVAELAHHGARGEIVFPSDIQISIQVPERSLAIARGFVDDPRFDREVGAALANRCDVPAGALPRRGYAAHAGERLRVSVAEQRARPWVLAVEGGDLDGQVLALPGGFAELTFGRGGAAGSARGQVDLAVCDETTFVSRRAGMIHRQGHVMEISALDQGDHLTVRRGDGEVIRPSRTARGRVAVHDGDAVELSDGRDNVVRLRVRRAPDD